MKRLILHALSFVSASLSLLIVLLSPRASAVVYYWDPNGLSAPTGGTWDTTTPQWSTTSALTATPVVWDPTVAAGFPAGTAGISALSISLNSPIGFAGIFNGLTPTIGVTNLVFSGNGSLNLNPGIQAFWTGSNAYNTIIRVPITGTGGVQNQSGGSLYLSGANTYSSGTSIGTSAGLNFNNGNAFGTGTITNSISTSVLATPATDSTGAAFATTPITISNPWQTFGGGNSTEILVGLAVAPVTFMGPWTLTSAAGTTTTLDVRITTWTISGSISGAANLTKINTATLPLSGANTYSGKTSINNGTASVISLNNVVGGSASSSLGAPTTVANGTINLGASTATGTLLYTGPGETTDRVINVAGTTGGGTIQNDGTAPLFSPAICSPQIPAAKHSLCKVPTPATTRLREKSSTVLAPARLRKPARAHGHFPAQIPRVVAPLSVPAVAASIWQTHRRSEPGRSPLAATATSTTPPARI